MTYRQHQNDNKKTQTTNPRFSFPVLSTTRISSWSTQNFMCHSTKSPWSVDNRN